MSCVVCNRFLLWAAYSYKRLKTVSELKDGAELSYTYDKLTEEYSVSGSLWILSNKQD